MIQISFTKHEQNFSRQEAMHLYIEQIARYLLDPEFVQRCVDKPNKDDARSFTSAARQIENLICTSRESLLGSGAWKQVGGYKLERVQARDA